MLSVRFRSMLLVTVVLLSGLTTACVSSGSSEPCVVGVDYEGKLYLEQPLVSEQPGPLLGTVVEHFCESGNNSQDDTPTSLDAHRLGDVDPKYAILVVRADGEGTKASSGTIHSLAQDEVPADVWSEIETLAD